MIVFFTLVSTALASAIPEDIYFEELSKPDTRRHLGSLPQDELVLNLKRRNDENVELHLKENKAININAPVYEARYENGMYRAALKRRQEIKGVRFYYDLDKNSAFQIRCEPMANGKCMRQIEGIVGINGEMYNVKPKQRRRRSVRYSRNMDTLPHLLQKSEVNNTYYNDISSNIDGEDLLNRNFKTLNHKVKRQEHKIYTVETIVAIDPPLWEYLVQRTKNKFGTTDDEVVEKDARRYYSMLIHLASMAYEGIKHPDFTVKIVVSGYLFLKKQTVTMIEDKVYTEDGAHTKGVHFGEALQRMYKEMRENGDLKADHVFTFTKSVAQGAAGANCWGCICDTGSWGWTISQADDMNIEARIVAHEIGHGLQLTHISKHMYDDLVCNTKYGYLMSGEVRATYWKFSDCSIRELQNYLAETGYTCLLDNADVYNSTEWNAYTSKMPGEIRNITEQCIDKNAGKLFIDQEKQSVLCNDVTDPDFCWDMSCVSESGCLSTWAADGTPCGLPSSNKWCIASRCVSKTVTEKERQCEEENWQYQKTLTQTREGVSCQRWDSQDPHGHGFKSADYFTDETVADAGNFCRNPDNMPYAWCYTTSVYTRWDYCDYQKCIGTTPETTGDVENCYKTWAETYLGTKSISKSGYTCQRWDSDSPHSHNYDITDKFLDASVADAVNYCRDPSARGTPWCVLDERWDYCDVPICSPEKQRKCAEENWQYQKMLTETHSGIPCQRWDSGSPHKNNYPSDSDFPDETVADAGNFCRNPRNDEKYAWCYTTDVNTRWDFCDIKKCKDDTCYSKDVEYTGTMNLTKGGIPCQSWNSDTPNKVNVKVKPEGNACRLLNEDSPWCYLGRSWDYCDIPKCT